MRQQRPARNRRTVEPNLPVAVSQIVVSPNGRGLHTIDMATSVAGVSPDSTFYSAVVSLDGIPGFRRELDNSLPTGAVLVGGPNTVRLTYGGAALTINDRYFIAARDPAIRTYDGGYVCPGLYAETRTPPTAFAFTAQEIDTTHTLIQLGGLVGVPVALPWEYFIRVGGGQQAIKATADNFPATIDGHKWVVEWNAPVAIGDTVRFAYPPLNGDGENWTAVVDTAVAITA